MSRLVDLLLSLPPLVVLAIAFLLPAAEASVFVGVLIPGETAVVVAGVLAQAGVLPLWAVMVASAAGAVLGDQIGFLLGRRYGESLLNRMPAWVNRHDRAIRVLDLVRRRGVAAVLLGRWTASLRAFVPGMAGLSGLRHRTFSGANLAGGVIWAVAVSLLGYLAGAGFRRVEHQLNLASGVVLGALALLAVALILIRRLRGRSRTPDAPPSPTYKDSHR